ncbi:MAG TPA: polysaccharide deacetylase family protein [Kofleriaceae bacterium]|nr:polysaccharide deacetylase family protein [Kofleriaceae bacterium]
MNRAAALLLALAACGGRRDITYHWDDQRVFCSDSIDDIGNAEFNWHGIDAELDYAADEGSVAIVHAHNPGQTVSLAAIERILTDAEERGLTTVTFRQLEDHTQHRGALAFAFDDSNPELWVTAQDLLAMHGAHITMFVTRWLELTDEQRADIATMTAAGHDVQPHSVMHLNAVQYVADHGLDAYIADEVLPSFTPLEQLGYPPTTFAYPFGAHDDEIDAAVLQHVSRVRAVGNCP